MHIQQPAFRGMPEPLVEALIILAEEAGEVSMAACAAVASGGYGRQLGQELGDLTAIGDVLMRMNALDVPFGAVPGGRGRRNGWQRDELLLELGKQASQLGQCATKALRFGLLDRAPNVPGALHNGAWISAQLSLIFEIVGELQGLDAVPGPKRLRERAKEKMEKMKQWTFIPHDLLSVLSGGAPGQRSAA